MHIHADPGDVQMRARERGFREIKIRRDGSNEWITLTFSDLDRRLDEPDTIIHVEIGRSDGSLLPYVITRASRLELRRKTIFSGKEAVPVEDLVYDDLVTSLGLQPVMYDAPEQRCTECWRRVE